MGKTMIRFPAQVELASKVGPRLYRKTILRTGHISKNGYELDVTPEYLAGLAANFSAGVMDAVPFVLADAGNRHNVDPERGRGHLLGVEVAGDRLVGTFQATARGAELLEENPQLGCSVSIEPEFRRADGRSAGPTLVHVAGTLDPEIGQLGDWVALSSQYERVVDLAADPTAPTPTSAGSGGDASQEGASMATTEEQIRSVLLKALGGGSSPAAGNDAPPAPPAVRVGTQPPKPVGVQVAAPAAPKAEQPIEITPEAVLKVLGDLLKGAQDGNATGEETEERFTEAELNQISAPAEGADEQRAAAPATTGNVVPIGPTGAPATPAAPGRPAVAQGQPVPIAAAAEGNEQLELANARIDAQAVELARYRAERDTERWERERDQLTRVNGVPAAAVELAKPLLFGSELRVELASGASTDPGAVMRKVLTEVGRHVKGLRAHLDLGAEYGTAESNDDHAQKKAERDAFLARAHAEMGTGPGFSAQQKEN